MANVLVVTQDADLARAVGSAAHALGHTVLVAPGASDGLACALRGAADLAVLDADLPLLGAVTLAYALDDADAGLLVPSLGLARPGEDWRLLLTAGMAAVLPKPVQPNTLRRQIGRMVGRARREPRVGWVALFQDSHPV